MKYQWSIAQLMCIELHRWLDPIMLCYDWEHYVIWYPFTGSWFSVTVCSAYFQFFIAFLYHSSALTKYHVHDTSWHRHPAAAVPHVRIGLVSCTMIICWYGSTGPMRSNGNGSGKYRRGGYETASTVTSSDLESTSFFDSEDDCSSRWDIWSSFLMHNCRSK